MIDNDIVLACASPKFVARFWSSVDKSGECWAWTKACSAGGYGVVSLTHRIQAVAHRVAWTLEHGPIPPDRFACHRCDNPVCVRPDHLFLGTAADNMRDKMQKGRHVAVKGEGHGMSRLTTDQIREIRALRGVRTQGAIAAEYGISQGHVSEIMSGRKWAHV